MQALHRSSTCGVADRAALCSFPGSRRLAQRPSTQRQPQPPRPAQNRLPAAVLNEPQRQQWSVSWDGAFQAVTNDGTIRFDDAQDKPEASGAGGLLLRDFRALVQQYYSHAEKKKSYIVHD